MSGALIKRPLINGSAEAKRSNRPPVFLWHPSIEEEKESSYSRIKAPGGLSDNDYLLRYLHPSSLRSATMYTSFLGILEALHLGIFSQPL